MDSIGNLQSLGITLPSPAYLFGAFLFSVLGFAAYRYGKRGGMSYVRWLGVALMLFPYGVSDTWALYVVGGLICVCIYWCGQQGR